MSKRKATEIQNNNDNNIDTPNNDDYDDSSTTTPTAASINSSTKSKSRSTKELNLYKKSYHGGATLDKPHWKLFEQSQKWTQAQSVLYPGCHRHVTAALHFPHVTFVDCDSKIANFFKDETVASYVQEQKVYDNKKEENNNEENSISSSSLPPFEFYCLNVHDNNQKQLKKVLRDDYDLLISLNAGIIAEACTWSVKPNGYLLVNDGHCDARMVFVNDNEWDLVAYWDDETQEFTNTGLERCFQVIIKQRSNDKKSSTTKNNDNKINNVEATTAPLTKGQALESVNVGTVRKRSFKLLFEPMFFLFQKKGREEH